MTTNRTTAQVVRGRLTRAVLPYVAILSNLLPLLPAATVALLVLAGRAP